MEGGYFQSSVTTHQDIVIAIKFLNNEKCISHLKT